MRKRFALLPAARPVLVRPVLLILALLIGTHGTAFAKANPSAQDSPAAPPPDNITPGSTTPGSMPPEGPPHGSPSAGHLPPGGMRGPMPKPTNLQVLPKHMTGRQVMKVMHGFEGQLGVECGFCHAANPATHHLNFPSDTKPEKATARLMLRMTAELNEKYLSQIKDPDHADVAVPPATCGTCHRGHSKPEAFVPPPETEHHHDDGPDHHDDDHQGPPPA